MLVLPNTRLELMTGAATPTPFMRTPPMSVVVNERRRRVPLLMLETVLTAKTSAVTPTPTDVAEVIEATLEMVEPAKVLVSREIGAAVSKPTTGS